MHTTIGSASGKVGMDDLFRLGENFFETHGGRVQNDRVGGGLKRRFGAVAVAVVALLKFAEDGFLGGALLFRCLWGGALAV